MSGWHKGEQRSVWGLEDTWVSPQCILPACFECDTPGPLWPRCSRHPDLTREAHLPPLPLLSSLVVNITQSIIIPPHPTSPTTSYSAKGFPRPRIDQPQHHSCKWKAGLQTAAVFVSLSSLKKKKKKKLKCWFNVALFFHSFLLLLFTWSQRLCPVTDLNVLHVAPAPRSQQQQCGRHGWAEPKRLQQKKRSKKSGLHVFGRDSEHLHFYLKENKTPVILKTVPVSDHLS